MEKPWSECSEEEKEKIRICSRERMRRYREEGRYGADWQRYHREARKKLEKSGAEKKCYSCGTTKRPVRTHHIDGDYTNNDLENLAYCCHSCDTREAFERKNQLAKEL